MRLIMVIKVMSERATTKIDVGGMVAGVSRRGTEGSGERGWTDDEVDDNDDQDEGCEGDGEDDDGGNYLVAVVVTVMCRIGC